MATDKRTMSEYCDEQMKTALKSLSQDIFEDHAEEMAQITGFHPDYFMPIGTTYKRSYPGAMNVH